MSDDLGELSASSERALAKIECEEHAPIEVDGFAISRTFRPKDTTALGHGLSQLAGSGLGVLVRGGATSLLQGNPPRRADLFVSTERIVGVDEFDSEDGVVHVRAGTPLESLREEAEARGWEVPLDPPGTGTTLGGVLARAAAGPRELGFGPVRRAVLGLDVVLASGTPTHCGGRVVKNVTGFDLAKLYVGSFGTLGVIDGAWLRLRPRPEAVRTIRARSRDRSTLLEFALRAARRPTARAAGVLCLDAFAVAEEGEPGVWHFIGEWAGEKNAVFRDAEWALEEAEDATEFESGTDWLRNIQAEVPGPGGLRLRLSTLPSRLLQASRELSGVARAQLIYPGQGTLFAFARAQDFEALSASCRKVVAETAGSRHRASYCFEALGLDAKRRGDVFAEPGAEGKILSSLKDRFDPEGLLNPGRARGRL